MSHLSSSARAVAALALMLTLVAGLLGITPAGKASAQTVVDADLCITLFNETLLTAEGTVAAGVDIEDLIASGLVSAVVAGQIVVEGGCEGQIPSVVPSVAPSVAPSAPLPGVDPVVDISVALCAGLITAGLLNADGTAATGVTVEAVIAAGVGSVLAGQIVIEGACAELVAVPSASVTPSETASAAPSTTPDDDDVTLCHATGSETNPYVLITVDAAGAANGHYGDDHQDGNDIIPEFTYQGEVFPAQGDQSILANDCVVAGSSVSASASPSASGSAASSAQSSMPGTDRPTTGGTDGTDGTDRPTTGGTSTGGTSTGGTTTLPSTGAGAADSNTTPWTLLALMAAASVVVAGFVLRRRTI